MLNKSILNISMFSFKTYLAPLFTRIFFIFFTAFMGPALLQATKLEEIPEITVFDTPEQGTLQASCCINGIVTYLEIYDSQPPVLGTYRLLSERKAPQPDKGVVKRLERAIFEYCESKNILLDPESAEAKPEMCDSEAPDTLLIPPSGTNNCCQCCIIS